MKLSYVAIVLDFMCLANHLQQSRRSHRHNHRSLHRLLLLLHATLLCLLRRNWPTLHQGSCHPTSYPSTSSKNLETPASPPILGEIIYPYALFVTVTLGAS